MLSAQSITYVRHFDTWGGSVNYSTDPAGIGYHAPSGHLYIADSEINELGAMYYSGVNIFEVSLSGNTLYDDYNSNNAEPTGITYSEYDGYFYVTNDLGNAGGGPSITRYNTNFNFVTRIFTNIDVSSATDPEGITCDPSTGNLYVADGNAGGRQVLVYNSDLNFLYNFSVGPGVINDPEGIAFHPYNGHLYIIDGGANEIYEYTTNGIHLETYGINFSNPAPDPDAAQGLTFAPTSATNDPANNLSLYIADGRQDNFPDGRIFEVTFDDISLPVTLSSFTAQIAEQSVELNWITESEIDNLGFKIYRTDEDVAEYYLIADYRTHNELAGQGNSSIRNEYSFIDNTVEPGKRYWYKLVDISYSGEETVHEPVFIDVPLALVDRFVLNANYPNPFNQTTTISFGINISDIEIVDVKINIHNVIGELIKTISKENLSNGTYKVRWDGTDEFGNTVAGGMYFYTLLIDNMDGIRFNETKRMILIK